MLNYQRVTQPGYVYKKRTGKWPIYNIVSCPGYGKTVSELENGHLEIVDFPIQNGDVP